MKKTLLLLLLSITFFNIQAQEDVELINSMELIREGVKLYNEEEYEDALEKYDQISQNDTNYLLALYQKALAHHSLEEYSKSITICKGFLENKNNIGDDNEYAIYNILGLSLDDNGNSKEAQKTYDEALKKYPKQSVYKLNKAVSYKTANNYESALQEYKDLLEFNPYYAKAHTHIGLLAANEEKHTQALMSLAMATILTGNSKELTILDLFAQQKEDLESKNLRLNTEKNADDFEDIDLLIENKVALNKKYKTPSKFEYPIIKQLYVMIENLEYNKKDEGFWMQYYVPYFKAMLEEKQFENFSYFLLGISSSESVQDKVKSKLNDMKEFYKWHHKKWAELHADIDTKINNKQGTYTRRYDKGILWGIGNTDKDNEFQGPWEFYFDNGKLKSKGNFIDNEKDGQWFFYNKNGTQSSEYSFKANERDGAYTEYDGDGYKTETGSYKDKKLNGVQTVFYKDGTKKSEITYKLGKADGTLKQFYPGGKLNYTIDYNNENQMHGDVKVYYPNQVLKATSEWKDGERNGKSISYHINKQISEDYTYKEGNYEGVYEEFYITGQLKEKGTYKKGISVGETVYYYQNGTVRKKDILDENGKLNGLVQEFAENGDKLFEADFSKGELKTIRLYNKDGSVKKEVSKKRNKLAYEFPYDNGQSAVTGLYDKDEEEGVWKYYRKNGTLEVEKHYKKGKLDGDYKEYYNTGQLEKEYTYDDGNLTSYYKAYYKDGTLKREGNFLNGNYEGKWISYYQNGEIEEVDYYLFNKAHGIQENFNIKGVLNSAYFYKNGTIIEAYTFDMQGNPIDTVPFNYGTATIEYKTVIGEISRTGQYKNGKAYGKHSYYKGKNELSSEGNYLNGEKQGVWKWYSFEKLSSVQNYENGEINGEALNYHFNGKLKSKKHYNYGVDVDTWEFYYENGKLNRDLPHLNGERHGKSHYYSSEGDLQYVKFHEHGYFVGYSYNDENGKLKEMIPLENESGMIKAYFPNGKLSAEVDVKNNSYVGVAKRYYKSGQLEISDPNELGLSNGKYESYYPNGQLKEEATLNNENYDGKRTLYYANGNKMMELNYIEDALFGKAFFYSEDGKLIKELKYYNSEIIEKKTF